MPFNCRVPNKATHGYDEGLIESADGDKISVNIIETKEVCIDGSRSIPVLIKD